ncbi:C40 family peptidase [Luteimonas sp. e5]
MKFELRSGRSSAFPQHRVSSSFRLSLLGLGCALVSAPAFAASDLPAVRSTDVQTITAAASSQSVLAGFDASALPQNLLLAPSGNAPLASPVQEDGRVQKLLKGALALLGTPYRWGGTTTAGFDCSGLVGYVFRTALGVDLPRVSRDMATQGERVARDELNQGDLVFFSRSGRRIDHVGIYVGDGRFVHAPRTGKDVMVSRMDTGYWSGKFMQARRVVGI